jgi:phenylacetate-CoA ligase
MAARTGFRLRYGQTALVRRWQLLEESQWWPAARIKEYQWWRLQRLLRHAYESSPYYGERMRAQGIHPCDIRTPADFARLPIMNKSELSQHLEEMVALGLPKDRLVMASSGGSTGAPVHLYHDREFIARCQAAKLRNFKWAGWQPGDAWARIWGSSFDLAPHERWLQRLTDRAMRARFLPAFDLSEERMAKFARELRRFRPDVIEAYATPMYAFAKFCLTRGFDGIRPRGIICSAEALQDHQRAAIEEAFNCRVFNRYGSRETGDVSQECELGTMHINSEHVYAEVVRDDRPAEPGETGEIIVTLLDLYSAPLLRYRIEDAGAISNRTCECGRGLPAMSSVEGRVQGLITLPCGTLISAVFFPHLFKDFDILEYQVVQESMEVIDIKIVAGATLSERDRKSLVRTITEHTKGEVRVGLTLVERIERSPSGKLQEWEQLAGLLQPSGDRYRHLQTGNGAHTRGRARAIKADRRHGQP